MEWFGNNDGGLGVVSFRLWLVSLFPLVVSLGLVLLRHMAGLPRGLG